MTTQGTTCSINASLNSGLGPECEKNGERENVEMQIMAAIIICTRRGSNRLLQHI